MPVTEVFRDLGSFSIRLRNDTPRSLIEEFNEEYFSHIIITPSRLYPPEEMVIIEESLESPDKVSNGGFENAEPCMTAGAYVCEPDAWLNPDAELEGWTRGTTRVKSGTWSAEMSRTEKIVGDHLVQQMNVQSGRSYRVRGWVAAEAGTNRYMDVKIYWRGLAHWPPEVLAAYEVSRPYENPNDYITGQEIPAPTPLAATTTFQEFDVTVTVPEGVDTMILAFFVSPASTDTGTGAWYVDDVSVNVLALDTGDVIVGGAFYTGVCIDYLDNGHEIVGHGLPYWLGDAELKGYIYETAILLDDANFLTAVTALFNDFEHLQMGKIVDPDNGKLYSREIVFVTAREALDDLCSFFEVDWHVNSNFKIDIGPEEAIFETNPRVIATRRDVSPAPVSRNIKSRALSKDNIGSAWVSDVILLGSGLGVEHVEWATASRTSDYKDFFGNEVSIKKVVDAPGTELDNEQDFADQELEFSDIKNLIEIDSGIFDPVVPLKVGDYIYMYDPVNQLFDYDNEISHGGTLIAPIKQRIYEKTWPVKGGMGVYLRKQSDEGIVDLSPWIEDETGEFSVSPPSEQPRPRIPTTLEELIGLQ